MGAQVQLHVALVSGPGLGHVNGCLQLAEALANAGFHVSLLCFQQYYRAHDAKGRIKKLSHPSVQLHVLADGISSDNPSYGDLFDVTPTMCQSLQHFVATSTSSRRIKCIIADTIMSWTQTVADQFGIPRVDYWTASARCYLYIIALPELHARGYIGRKGLFKLLDELVEHCAASAGQRAGFPDLPADEIPRQFRIDDPDTPGVFHTLLHAAPQAKQARCVLLHSMYDLEPAAFDILKQIGVHAYGIAPLLSDTSTLQGTNSNPALTWLDEQSPGSVIYIAFGSNVSLHVEEVAELAHGLEASGQPFLWVIRSDAIAGHDVDIGQVLPSGFLTRVAKRGLVIDWAPQMTILGHPSVGGFLSHCGWNSTLESLWMGVPILACPRSAEQSTNCRMMTQHWGTGIRLEVEDPHDAALIRKGHVEAGVRELMTGSAGEQARANAKKFSRILREAATTRSKLTKFAMDVKDY